MDVFFEINSVPVNSVLLLKTREEATNFPRGNIKLGFCNLCGFISNLEFNTKLVEYSSNYEATQSYSPSFNAYLTELATRLVHGYDLHQKQIIEVGCGQGEFLTLICKIGNNHGIGYDPVFREKSGWNVKENHVKFVKDYFSEKYSDLTADFVCCRMTLEHIKETYEFVNMIRKTIGEQDNTILFFQVPDIGRILRELAFWDIYYEHCSYFCPGSLAHLFRKCGFEIIDLELDYSDQYINIISKKGNNFLKRLEIEDDLDNLSKDVSNFISNYDFKIHEWRKKVDFWLSGKRTIIWGASSKCVSFLTNLNIRDEISYVVDINPRKQGTFIAGTGQEIISPEQLPIVKPEVVIVMNPIYITEIESILKSYQLFPNIFSP
jgi:hypothetical protein